jgi:hypothetical protein
MVASKLWDLKKDTAGFIPFGLADASEHTIQWLY